MSGSLGTGYVAVTPINLQTIPRDLEGSKAGLLTLNWALVKSVNHSYVQPVNLLQLYQTGQFTTVQAVLIDNSLVSYPVRVASISTGQKVTCPPYSQVMAPLLVSVAANFTVSLIVPLGTVTALDQVATQIFFLNTPQTPYQVIGNASVGTTALTLNQSIPLVLPATGTTTSSASATLIPSFTPGTQQISYTNITVQATPPATGYFVDPGGSAIALVDFTLRLTVGSNTFWANTQTPWPPINQVPQPYTVSAPLSGTNTDGSATLLTGIAAIDPQSVDVFGANTVTLNVNLLYNIITPPT